MVKVSDLRMLEVINIADGKRLGNLCDIELDEENGKITAFIMPGGTQGWMLFKRREEQVIPWDCMVNIGQDVLLVELVGDWKKIRKPPEKNRFPDWDEDDFEESSF